MLELDFFCAILIHSMLTNTYPTALQNQRVLSEQWTSSLLVISQTDPGIISMKRNCKI
jgi:hypothetical protein